MAIQRVAVATDSLVIVALDLHGIELLRQRLEAFGAVNPGETKSIVYTIRAAIEKLVVDGDSGRVLGAHMLGPDAGDMVQLLAIPLRLGATKADFDRTIALHPTAAEELVTMRSKTYSRTP